MKRIVFLMFVTVAAVLPVVAEETVAVDGKPGFWAREWQATKRICLSPVPIVKGTWNTCKDLTVGLAELLTGCTFGGPVSADAGREAPPGLSGDASVAKGSDGASTAGDDDALRAACEREDWKTAVKLCRLAFAKRTNDGGVKATRGVRLAMACWNDGDRIGAVVAMDATVSVCARVDAAREQAASRFRADLRKKPVSESFSAAQIMGAADVLR